MLRELSDELLAYDLERHKASCLNRIAALTLQRCDGSATVEEIAEDLRSELGLAVDERAVWLALDRLGRAHLLEEPVVLPSWAEGYSRREWAAAVAKVSGAAVATVVSILSPTAAAAQSLITVTDCSLLTSLACGSIPCTGSSKGMMCAKTNPFCQPSGMGFCKCCG